MKRWGWMLAVAVGTGMCGLVQAQDVDLDMTGRQRSPVGGEVPSPINPPSSCTFHPRCPFANDRCKAERPKALPIEGGTVACHAIEERRLPIEDRSYALNT